MTPTHTQSRGQMFFMPSIAWTYHTIHPAPSRLSRRAPASPPLRRAAAISPIRASPRPRDNATLVPSIRHQAARPRVDRLTTRYRRIWYTLLSLVAWYVATLVASPRTIVDATANAAATGISTSSSQFFSVSQRIIFLMIPDSISLGRSGPWGFISP